MPAHYDAILVVSFGGPEGADDVIPFLENVLRGKNVPRERLLEVAGHYDAFGGVSPINQQNRELIDALRVELTGHGVDLPIYWGNRNWRPMLADTLGKMADDGVQRALAYVTSAFSSYSGCRQYLEDIQRAQDEVGTRAPVVDKLRGFFNHPGFIESWAASLTSALGSVPEASRSAASIVFTAHSIPRGMADGCQYVAQLNEACRLVCETVGVDDWHLVYQSRSGPPSQPWLEPDVCDFLRQQHQKGALSADAIILPIGFLSDHLEVLFDLDTEAKALCDELGVNLVRAATPGAQPRFVQMIRELIVERTGGQSDRPAVGRLAPCPNVCPSGCCNSGVSRPEP